MTLSKTIKVAEQEWAELISGKLPAIFVGNATCGRSAGSEKVIDAFIRETSSKKLDCSIKETGCIGMCYQEPLVCIYKPGFPVLYYGNVSETDATELVNSFLMNNTVVTNNMIAVSGKSDSIAAPDLLSTAVMKSQERIVLKNCGLIDPTSINHYIANKGYSGLSKALTMHPEKVLDEIMQSGLRGRGGAGFPTWRKWKFCRDTIADTKYLICNADEGDPGAFMNRSLMEGDPHSLIEGMIIAAYTIGVNEGYIYCRAEYPLALLRLRAAIAQAEKNNLLGKNIMGKGFSFSLKIKEGAGAFVCGEETALIASIEGERGMPRLRPPFPAVKGLWNKPTIINNVETLASVARILQYDSKWYSGYGTEQSKGTKTFALVGKINNCGLIEVPLGTSLREIIFDIGGGVPDGKKFKAVQTGGPSGGCVPERLLDVPVDYESLGEIGTIMGSGGLVVMDEDTCMVDVARYFLDFATKESCGECAPCRLGTRQMLDILDDITNGKGKPRDIDLLLDLGEGIMKGSLCGLGQTAPNPVVSTIKYFRKEYEDHILHNKCTAKVCKELISYIIVAEKCTGCHLCAKPCPVNAISGSPKDIHTIDQNLCIKCGVCYEKCPVKFSAIEVLAGSSEKKEDNK